jgi:hypothetical protein
MICEFMLVLINLETQGRRYREKKGEEIRGHGGRRKEDTTGSAVDIVIAVVKMQV